MLHTPRNFEQKLISRNKVLDLSRPRVMGILNVTPDSFSDGGCYTQTDAALRHCEQMMAQGVDIIDIGGESTRPNAATVSLNEEMDRVLPVVEAIRHHFGEEIWLSLDTSRPEVMQQGVSLGADMINDVRALSYDGARQVAATLDVPVVLMHNRGEPTTMNQLAYYQDIVTEIQAELNEKIQLALSAGIARRHLVVDIGMGFAKNYAHHQQIMRKLADLVAYFDLPMLFGVSRKRFLGEILTHTNLAQFQNHQPKDRDIIGAGMSLLAVQAGARIVRVHDVAHSVQMLSMWSQIYQDEIKSECENSL